MKNHQQILIHSIVSLSNLIVLIILSNQFPINTKQILVQTHSINHFIIGRLESRSFVNIQYVIVVSYVIIIILSLK